MLMSKRESRDILLPGSASGVFCYIWKQAKQNCHIWMQVQLNVAVSASGVAMVLPSVGLSYKAI